MPCVFATALCAAAIALASLAAAEAQTAKAAKRQTPSAAASARSEPAAKREPVPGKDWRYFDGDSRQGLRDQTAPAFPLRSPRDTQAFWDSMQIY